MSSLNFNEVSSIPEVSYPFLAIPSDIDPTLLLPAQRLLDQYYRLAESLATDPLDFEDMGRPRFSNHLAEDASDAQEWQSRAAISHHLAGELQRVLRAYALLQQGVYGTCEVCAHPIPLRRLMIRPSATLCVQCQEKAETQH